MPHAVRNRILADFLVKSGVKEPEESHIVQTEALLYSEKPSARASFPGGVTIARNYDRLEALTGAWKIEKQVLPCPGEINLPGLKIICEPAQEILQTPEVFTVSAVGTIYIGSRQSGDSIRLHGGTRSLKKLFIDRKIPAAQRDQIPVLRDEGGLLGVYSVGADLRRRAESLPAVAVRFIKTE